MSLEEREGLPVGWVETTLGEATKIVAGGTPSAGDPSNFETDSGIPWLTPADLSGYKEMYIGSGKRNLSQKGYHLSSATIMPSGSVLFSSRAPIGYVAIASNEISTNQGFKSFIITNEIYNKFLYFYLKSIKDIAEQAATGTTFKELSGAATSQLPLILPPFAEQVRIADKLDVLLSRVEAGRERLERVPKLVKRFRQSVLSAAVSGELTREWRADGDAEWSTQPFANIASIRGGTTAVPQDQTTDYPVLRSSSIKNYSVDLADIRYINPAGSNSKNILIEGDLLFTRLSGSIEYVANCAVVKELAGRKIEYPDRIFCAKVNRTSTPEFIAIAFSSNEMREPLIEVAKSSAGHQRISIQDLLAQVLKLPPLPEQTEIVRRVEALFALANRLEARAQAALARYSRLTPALLAKAFRGELVPQDPADEPASVLLERIRAQREAAGPAKKAPGRGRKLGAATHKVEVGVGAGEPQSGQKRGRGRPRKVQEGAGQAQGSVVPVVPPVPTAGSYEEAVQLLRERGQARAEGARQAELFGEEVES